MTKEEIECIKEKIFNFIELGIEGPNWDFKQKWHRKKTKKGKNEATNEELLHDIICMANNVDDSDSYIIIGVDDKTHIIHDITKDPDRRNTQDIVNLLRNGRIFANDNIPDVYVLPIQTAYGMIDVIVIKNSNKTPFYLVKPVGQLLTGHIYTRIMDGNTAKNCTADSDVIKRLWLKEYGLNLYPKERLPKLLSDPSKWEPCPDDNFDKCFIHKIFSNFAIKIKWDNLPGRNSFYSYIFLDHSQIWGQISIYYSNQVIYKKSVVSLDGGRISCIAPKENIIEFNNMEIPVCYFIKGSIEYYLKQMFNERISLNHFSESFNKLFYYFSSEKEKEFFYNKARNFVINYKYFKLPIHQRISPCLFDISQIKEREYVKRTFKRINLLRGFYIKNF